MAVKIQFKYGQYPDKARAIQDTLDTPGLVIFNGTYQEIYVDGKTFAASSAPAQELVNRVIALETFRRGQHVTEYAQAQVSVNSVAGTSQLLIANLGQGSDSDNNDGKIFSTGNFAVKIDGVYNENTNKIATQDTVNTIVNTAVGNLRAEILGTINPEELDKTLDTIKEIQEVLINGSYTITHTDPITHETEQLRTARVETLSSIIYTDGGNPDYILYATQSRIDPNDIAYEDGYSNLVKSPSVDSLIANVGVHENEEYGFVTASRNNADVTLNINFGTFKDGDAVMDPTSDDFINGLATVEDVQEYIEKRFSWITYEPNESDESGDEPEPEEPEEP